MQNESGEVVDIYIPRKWYVWSASLSEKRCQV